MLRIKNHLSALLAVAVLMGSASFGFTVSANSYVYPDTAEIVDGVEVFKTGATNWVTKYQGDGNTAIYTTHDAYEGNAALLIKPVQVGTPPAFKTAFPSNNGLAKTGGNDAIIAGDNYKIVVYQKPVIKNESDKYKLINRIRYYDLYDAYYGKIYDAETGVDCTTAWENAESKWYRTEFEFTAAAKHATGGVGTAFVFEATHATMLIDNLEMFHKVDGEWVLMADGTGVKNGYIESGVAAVKGADPKNVTAKAGVFSATISWTNPQEQKTRVYYGSTLLATAESGETSVTISNLSEGVEYNLTVKGVIGELESTGVNVTVTPIAAQYPDTIASIGGVEVFKKDPIDNWEKLYMAKDGTNQALYLTHDAYRGSSAMLVKSDTAKTSDITNKGYKKTGNTNPADNMVVGDTYKIELYQKPVATDSAGKYQLCTGYRYYDNYNVYDLTVYDAETGALVNSGTALESKWYRLEREFVAEQSDINGINGAFALWTTANLPLYIVDEIKMYHKVNGVWVAMTDGSAVANGSFEKGVEPFYGMDPENITVENKTESAIISWTNPQEQKTKVYNGGTLLATAESGVTSVTLSGLTADTEYNLTIKGVGFATESEGVVVNVFPYARLSDTVGIINGIEVCKTNAEHWLTTYQDKPSTIYTTREAYEGNAALLIVPSTEGTSYPANKGLSKAAAANEDKDKIIEGHSYKVVYYQKPISLNATNVYNLSKSFRYYGNYDVYTSNVYDAQTGAAVAANDTIESKWYRLEGEFTAKASSATGDVGFAAQVLKGSSAILLDSLSVYHKVGTEWVLMKDMSGARNGGLEEGIAADNTAPYEVENFIATSGKGEASLVWDKVEVTDLAGYTLWDGNTKIADLARNVTSYLVKGLTNDVQYTFIIKVYDRSGNSSEGTEVTVTPTIPQYETGNYIMGSKVVQGTNSVSIQVTNNKRTNGLNAQLILGLYEISTNTLVKASASVQKTIEVGSSDTLTANIVVDNLTAGNFEIRAFLWESLDSVSPLQDSVSIGE